jgi:hypothetical protein
MSSSENRKWKSRVCKMAAVPGGRVVINHMTDNDLVLVMIGAGFETLTEIMRWADRLNVRHSEAEVEAGDANGFLVTMLVRREVLDALGE